MSEYIPQFYADVITYPCLFVDGGQLVYIAESGHAGCLVLVYQ